MKKRNKKNKNKKLWRYLAFCVFIGFGTTIPVQISLAFIANYYLDVQINIPNLTWIVFLSLLVGAVIFSLISKRLLTPLSKLGDSMGEVANGNFEIQLETNSRLDFVQDIYSDFNLMVKELSATETLQTDFVSNVSHEFKTPLTAIEGYATLLQDCSDSQVQSEYVDKIIFNTQRLSTLVGSILLLSKVDNKAIQTKQATYSLDEQIRQTIVFSEPKWSAKEIDFDVDLAQIDYCGDEGMLFHVWSNLIGNAIKFSPDGGTIKIKLAEKNEKIVFTVEDEGCGIEPESLKHIFNKFYQADSSHKAEGNGLGLSLAKGILELCGGTVSAENIPSGGAKFTVTL